MQIILDLHRRSVEAIQPIIARIRPADLGRPTPCVGWDLRALQAHMIGQDHGFATAVAADVPVEAFAPREPSLAAHRASCDRVVEAFAAADPTRHVLLAEFENRRFPLRTVVGFHLLDTLVHGWDVAAALGTEVDYGGELLAAVHTQAELVPGGPARTGPGAAFAPGLPIAGTSTGWTRTLALLGRDPRWTAGTPNHH
ncbi:TIGR03086 family metal-binding protein [Actinokineospora sp. NBRC 105648]|uniref:TIGR03086 family metal-binding protein n=1 Tax=Actinokineospora sp. NBRC 105648 TaxID=3032206 RepID=UPI0024A1CA9F|nr:TIGR03086 family metal-binding protein [Actinokineospora sp. NBRC 105648]GLZ42537.1 TIGR03086 family protein [Actinokineospora sp. NBRC 105648]